MNFTTFLTDAIETIRESRAKTLETEEKGKEIARTQGFLEGLREIGAYLEEEPIKGLVLGPETTAQIRGSLEELLALLSDETVLVMQEALEAFREGEGLELLAKLRADIAEIQVHLGYTAESARELFHAQGEIQAYTIIETIDLALAKVARERAAEAEVAAKEAAGSLDF